MRWWRVFWWGIGFIVVGFVLVVVGTEVLGVGATGLPELIQTALTNVFTNLEKVVVPDATSAERLQALGSAFIWIGFILFAVSLYLVFSGRRSPERSDE
jgi:hypothetical protein